MSTRGSSADRAAAARSVPRRRGRRMKNPVANILAVLFSVVWIFPVYWMINTAFMPQSEIMSARPHFVPFHPTLQNFGTALSQPGFWQAFRNSVIVVLAAVLFATILALFASAALSRFRFRGRRAILVVILAVQMVLGGPALLIPQFLIFNNLGLLNSYPGLILAYVAIVLPFSIWTLRGFYLTIPVELEEAAMMDGASTWRTLWSVLFPLVLPGMIATSVFAFISAWNEYIMAYTFMKDQTKYTLPIWLASFTNPNTGVDYGGQMAASILFALPVVIFFLIIQRNLVAGMSAGAVKG
jgi:N,N'-diacetylchitobiose transport system permease protein